MAPDIRRLVAWLPFGALLALLPITWLTAPASAENRKFMVVLADPPKDHPGGPTQGPLPRRSDVFDQYFDNHFKDGVNGGPRVDSFAEWWEEVSYGDVTVSGNTYGWVSLPWPTRPSGFNGDTSFGGTGTIQFIDLNGNFTFEPGAGEAFNPFVAKYPYDVDGPNAGADPFDWPGAGMFTEGQGIPQWSPGERFRDLNNNRVYDAGVPEIWIDKDGDGEILPEHIAHWNTTDFRARAAQGWRQLLSGAIIDCTDPANPTFQGWDTSGTYYEALDFNEDGEIGLWGAEPWVDLNGDGQLGQQMQGQNGAPPNFVDFIIAVNLAINPCPGGQTQNQAEWFDLNQNNVYDYPEPYEDFMRRWDAQANEFIPITNGYVAENTRGDHPEILMNWDPATNPAGRTGNHIYDAPDDWTNTFSQTGNMNKLQLVFAFLQNQQEFQDQQTRQGVNTPEPSWLEDFWQERYNSPAPLWDPTVPYVHKVDPAEAVPQPLGSQHLNYEFAPNQGGPTNQGRNFVGSAGWAIPFQGGAPQGGDQTGAVLPNPADGRDGFYDADAEYDDLPSSIYYTGGDNDLGEVTSPENDRPYGFDAGSGTPNSPTPDGITVAGGPLAFNVHGDGGYDAGNQQNIELLTWTTTGPSRAHIDFDIDGDGVPEFTRWFGDNNLDGMLDLGETPGMRDAFGLPRRLEQSNYGVDGNPGTPPNGGPSSEYPYNRHRLLESIVAALDDSLDFDEFLGGPPPFGDVISGLVLLPAGTAQGMFALPAPSFNQPILTRDHTIDANRGRAHYDPILFWDGLGIGLNDGAGEGDSFAADSFHLAFACHEYGHSWEGFPDLYDYDVYRTGFTGRIINNPIGAWCVMAGGGAVHPVPILKEDSGWIEPVDITRILTPAGNTDITLNAWEFDRFRTVLRYDNPLYPSEQFYFWRNSPGTIENGDLVHQAFDIRQPGWGVLIMHVDREGNLEGLPLQQRLESHFVYGIEQADGLEDLESGRNFGDDGDVFPGSSGNTHWGRATDPSNAFFSGQSSGLEITNINQLDNSSRITFRWFPRELPTFEWVQPPGGVSVNGRYALRYIEYDQYGGTQTEFYAVRAIQDQNPQYADGLLLGPAAVKQPGEIDGVYQVNVRQLGLEDGTYVFYAKMIPGIGADGNQESFWSVPRAYIDNKGTGTLTVDGVDPAISRFERWTIRCTNDNPPGQETWSVEGSLSGLQQATATTGVPYHSDADNFGRSALSFTIVSGAIPFDDPDEGDGGDKFTFLTSGLTGFSSAVLVREGEVVQPLPPVAVATTDNNLTSGLAPLTVTFRHNQSTDPLGASLTFRWDFNDGTPSFTTTQLDRPVTHTFNTPGTYNVVLTVTNSFNLSSTATVPIIARTAQPPTVRASVTPATGASPLHVILDARSTTDPNNGTQSLDFVWSFADGSPDAVGARVEHTYQAPGTYRATVAVTNHPFNRTASKTLEIRVSGPPANQPPNAAFTASRLSGKAPLTVNFDGTPSSDPENSDLEYEWTFGDGSAAVRGVATTTHTFAQIGTYNVQLKVTDRTDQSDTATLAIVVTTDTTSANQSPVARISLSSTQGAAPFAVTLDARNSTDPDGGNLSYAWDFGDGSPQVEGGVVDHTYTTPRQYTITLVVSDEQGATGATTRTVNVTSPADQSGRPGTGTGNPLPEVPTQCGGGGGCGPVGLTPMVLTLLGIGGLRRSRKRWMR